MKPLLLFVLTVGSAQLSYGQINLGRPQTRFGTYAQRPVCNGSIDLYLFRDTGSLLNDSVCDGGQWIDRRNGAEMKAPVGTWTWTNQGSSAQSTVAGRPRFTIAGEPGLHGAWLPYTSGPATLCVSMLYGRAQNSGCNFALVHEDGDGNNDNDKLLVFGPGGPTPHLTGSITFSGSGIQGLFVWPYDSGNVDFQCARVNYDAAANSFLGSFSLDGVEFSPAVPIGIMGPPDLQSPFIPKGFGFECNGGAGIAQTVTVIHHE